MAEENRWSTRYYDFAKGAVLLVLLLLLVIAFVQSPNAAPDRQQSPPVGAAPVWDPPQTAADGTVSLSGSAEPGSSVELWAGEIKLATVAVDADGSWSYVGLLDPGDYQIVARTVSAEGQVLNESQAVVLHIDGTTPQAGVTVAHIESRTVEPGGAVSLSGSAEPGSTVELWAGEIKLAAVPVDTGGSWSYTGQLDPGDYQIVARTVSAEGLVLNESGAVAVSVSATRAVAVNVNEPQVDTSGQLTLSGTGEPGSKLDILDNGVVVASAVVGEDGAWTVHYAASTGEHTLAVQVQGQAGEGSTTAQVAVAVPATAAAVAATAAVPTTVAVPATVGGHSYVVQPGDWLMKLARRYYGDSSRWVDIHDATNAKAASDPSYHKIGNPGYLSPGWKIWIPEP